MLKSIIRKLIKEVQEDNSRLLKILDNIDDYITKIEPEMMNLKNKEKMF